MFEHVIEGCQCEGKVCSKCEQKKCSIAFGKCNKAPDKLRWDCKACRKTDYEANREQVLEDMRIYYAENSEQVKARVQRYREENPELVQQQQQTYRLAHLEKITAYIQQWRIDHPEQLREYERVRKLTKADQLLEYDREYRRAHPEKEKAKKHTRRAREAAGGRFTDIDWKALCEFYRYTCLCCEATDKPLTPDHIIPLSKGGSNTIDNIQPLCMSCNRRKGTRIIDYRIKETCS